MNNVLSATPKSLQRYLQGHLQKMLQELALGYAWIVLLPSWRAGVLLAALTFVQPTMGLAGALAALVAWYAGWLAGADATERPVCVFNGLLCGLFVGYVWASGLGVLALAVMGGVFSGWLTVVLGRLAWSLVQMPILSIPFAVVTMLTAAAGASLSTLRFNPYRAPPELFGSLVDPFFSAFGALYFMPDPRVGLAITLLLVVFSRYYLLLALLGFAAAQAWFNVLGAAPEHLASTGWGSNAILAALLVGGLFASPSLLTAAHALLAAVLAAWLSLSLGRVFDVTHLVPFSAPFVLAAWLVLYAALRNTRMAGRFNLLYADLPERTFERTQVSLARVGSAGSVPLSLPFMGAWTVSQSFNGKHTHKGLWRHALDFMVVKSGLSYTSRGARLEDFYCYNLPVVSPAYGQVWRIVNDVSDNAPGDVNLSANWGNSVLIRLADGHFVLLAHLKFGTVAVLPGAWLKPGDVIGRCGNSGRSMQPHIHLHVQASDDMAAPTVAFHMAGVMVTPPGETPVFKLATVPLEASTLTGELFGDVRPLYLLPGRGLTFAVERSGIAFANWSVWCEIDDKARLTLVASSGARCVAESTWAVFACYDRNRVPDPCFDIWLLACGYSPAATQVSAWQDACVPARLLPNLKVHAMAALLWPLSTFAEGNYTRTWDADKQQWRQTATHRQKLTGLSTQTFAMIKPQFGCTSVEARIGNDHYILQATCLFQHADLGVPAWTVPLIPVGA